MSADEPINIMDARIFARWWTLRNLPNDLQIRDAAVQSGLVNREGGMLILTKEGRSLRRRAERELARLERP